MLFSIGHAKRVAKHGVLSLSVHPGFINTPLARYIASMEELAEIGR